MKRPTGVLIGLGYKADTGKDTIAAILTDNFAFRRFAFGDILRVQCRTLFGWTDEEMTDRKKKEEFDGFWGMTRRQGVQRQGDAVRNEFGADIMIRSMGAKIEASFRLGQPVVISDIRTSEEVVMVTTYGGELWRVQRDVAKTIDAHKTETALDGYRGWTAVIDNNGTHGELEDTVNKLTSKMLKKKD